MSQKRNAYTVLAGKPERMRSPGRHKRRWEDNIKINLKQIWRVAVYCSNVAQNRDKWRPVTYRAMKLRFHEQE
jgi:hypothetical protein